MGNVVHVEPAALAARLAQRLRTAGLPVGADHAGRFAAALRLVPPDDRSRLYWTARVVFVADHSGLAAFDDVFTAVFGGETDHAAVRNPDAPQLAPRVQAARPLPWATPASGQAPSRPAPDAGESEAQGSEMPLLAASARERLRTTSFADLAPDELAALGRWIQAVALAPPRRRSRRVLARPSGSRLDLRRTLRDARRTGGDPVRLARSQRRMRRRRLVLLCDVSGSMEPYTRAYLTLLQGAVRGASAEAFVFATRLTRLTDALADRDPDAALRRAAAVAQDWTGGTRIAASLRTFVREHGHRARGAVVIILSDGWERDDPSDVGEQTARLRRLAHRVVWVNPRAAADGYAPQAAGMAAALPHVDAFVSGHSLAALGDVADAVRGKGAGWRSTARSW